MTRSRNAKAVATNQSRGVAAAPSLPIARVSLARTLALKASRSASLAGRSAIGAGNADSAELDLASGGESNPKFGMSLAMLIENACKPGAGRGAPPLARYYTPRPSRSSRLLRHKPAPARDGLATPGATGCRQLAAGSRFQIPAKAGVHLSAARASA